MRQIVKEKESILGDIMFFTSIACIFWGIVSFTMGSHDATIAFGGMAIFTAIFSKLAYFLDNPHGELTLKNFFKE